MSFVDEKNLMRVLQNEIPILTAQIRALYAEMDKKFHLYGAQIPISFGFEKNLLGSYTQKGINEEEHFHFSLFFVGYAVTNPLSKEDRIDLYKHEYAHYMQFQMEIPKEYTWQAGIHGSAWKYCCSLIGAVPTPYYKAGEALLKHDYEKALKKPIQDKTIPIRDNYRREQQYKDMKNRVVQFGIGDEVNHPKFGKGIIEKTEQLTGSVRLHIRFGEELKMLDQKWLLRMEYREKI